MMQSECTPLKAGLQSLRANLSPGDLFGLGCPNASPLGSPSVGTSMVGPGTNFTSAVDYAFNAPTVTQKCAELGVFLDHCPQKDLASVYHKIIEKVFSLGSGGRGLGIAFIQSSVQPRDFVALSEFLSSTGPLLRAGAKLLSDPYLRFDFPASLLSPSTQQQMEAGLASQFISSKLSPHRAGVLLLNSFEFYMFSFAAYIVQPYTQDNKFVAGESLYPSILEDYFSYFLPCDGSSPPQLPFCLSMASPPPPPPVAEVNTATSPQSRRSLLRQGSMLATPNTQAQAQQHSMVSGHEVWRSETMINVFSELWLAPFSAVGRSKNESPTLSQTKSDISIAVGDTLRIVRMMIKHLHYFANSAGPLDLSPLDHLKRCVVPSIKRRIYLLFKFIFIHWPHDTSFRLVLETWLSYIQPWRYTNGALRSRTNDEGITVTVVDDKWQPFVADNILFYTNVLRWLLPRFFRMDLTSSKNAYMLLRIAKIFSQKGLRHLIRDGESGLDRIMSSLEFSLDRAHSPRGDKSFLSNTFNVSDSVILSGRQCLLELEGAGARYEPVFGSVFRQTVSEVLLLATRARAATEHSLTEINKSQKKADQGTLVRWISALFVDQGSPLQSSAEKEEVGKCVQYLAHAIAMLSDVFDLQLPQSTMDGKEEMSGYDSGSPETTEDCSVLTPHGRWQILNGLAKPDIKFEGDPDLVPIRGCEVTWLVRQMHRLASSFNQRYEAVLSRTYQEDTVPGELARLVLQPPCRFYSLEKSLDGGPPRRVYSSHPPRISLRFVGSQRFLIYTALFILVLALVLRVSLVYSSVVLLLSAGGVPVAVAALRGLLAPTKPCKQSQHSSKED